MSDPLKDYLPSDEEIEKAMQEAMRQDAASGGMPSAGPTFQALRENMAARGKVLLVDHDAVVVDLSYKSEGVIAIGEFGSTPPAVGDEVEAWVMALENADGQVVLSIKEAQRRKVWDSMSDGAHAGAVLSGKVTEAVKGGCVVDVGMRAFMPARECDLRYVEDLSTLVGKDVSVKVIEADRDSRNVVVSRRAVLQEEREQHKSRLFETLAEGQMHHGTVTNITDFGAFVDIGGAEGLIHKDDLAWGRVERVSDILREGQQVEVTVLKFDRVTEKISLSVKRVDENPWTALDEKYPFATIVRGTVTRLEEFGAFVKIEDDEVEGLVHVSELAWNERVHHPKEKLSVGEQVTVIVIGSDAEQQRLSLSIKQTEPDPWWEVGERYAAGKTCDATITRLENFGAFAELEKGLEGLIHVSNMGDYRVSHPRDVVKVGARVTVEVLDSSEEARRIGLRLIGAGEDLDD